MLGNSLGASLSSVVSSCRTGSDSSAGSATLSSSRAGSKRPSTNDGSSIRGGSKRPRRDVGSQGTPSSSASIGGTSAGGGVSTGNTNTGLTGNTATSAGLSSTNSINMLTVKEAKMPALSCTQRERCMYFNHLAHISRGVTVSESIPMAVGVNSLPPSSEFERNYGMEVVRHSIDSGCWPPEDVVAQANMEMTALIHAAGNILLQLNNLSKQCETQCAHHTGLLLDKLLTRVGPLYMLTNRRILQPGDSVIFQMLARHLNNQKKQEMLDILNHCGCQRCQRGWSERSSSLDEDKFEINDDLACVASQHALTVVAKKYSNTGKTSLHDCHTFMKKCPSSVSKGQVCAGLSRPLVVSGLFNNVIRQSNLGSLIPLYEASQSVHFVNGGVAALSAIHLVDGDGGFLVLDKFPGLLEKLGRHGISMGFEGSSRRQTWLPFRDLHHDAVEMKHCYGFQRSEDRIMVEYNLGLEAFFHAMDILNSAIRVAVLVEEKGQPSFSNPRDRLMVTLLIQKVSNGAWQPLGVEMVKRGLSFLKNPKNAPSDYLGASNEARLHKKGMFQIPEELLNGAESGHMPWALRDQVNEEGTAHRLAEVGGGSFYVKVKKSNLHQSMLFVDDSLIANAGQGLFLRPDQHGTFYRKNTVMCFYSRVTLSNEQVLQLPCRDYLMKVRNGYVDASKFEGFNLGRFANQGGLPQALKRLVIDLQLRYNRFDEVLKEANRHCQLHFCEMRGGEVGLAVNYDRLTCHPTNAIELYVDYDIVQYWLNYLSGLDNSLGNPDNIENELIHMVRWIVAENSRYNIMNLPHSYEDDVVERFKVTEVRCPMDMESQPRRR